MILKNYGESGSQRYYYLLLFNHNRVPIVPILYSTVRQYKAKSERENRRESENDERGEGEGKRGWWVRREDWEARMSKKKEKSEPPFHENKIGFPITGYLLAQVARWLGEHVGSGFRV